MQENEKKQNRGPAVDGIRKDNNNKKEIESRVKKKEREKR